MPYVAAIPALGLLAGAAAGLLLPSSFSLLTFFSAILPAAFCLGCWSWRAGRTRVLAGAVVAGFCAGGTLLSAAAWERAWRPPLWTAFESLARTQRAEAEAAGRRLPQDDEAIAVVEGVLRGDAAATDTGVSLSIVVDSLVGQVGQVGGVGQAGRAKASAERTHGGVAVTVVGALAVEQLEQWRAGRRVRMPVTLRRPSRYLDPGVPDHERALARRGTRLVGTVKSGALVEVLARGGWFAEAMSGARGFARRAIATSVARWDARSGAIVAAIVIGDRAGLDDEVQRRLQDAGTYHVIAISGGNIAILAGLLLGAFRLAGWLGRTAMLASIAALLVYAELVGNGASVDRATLMAAVYFAARAADHRSPPLNAMALVAAILVAADPLSVADPAFVLTFGATLAILVVVPVMTKQATAKNAERATPNRGSAFLASSAVASLVWPMFAASLAAEALLFPIGALTFSRVTFAGLALNFLAIPLMAVAQIAGMAVVPLALVSRDAAALAGWAAHIGAAGLVRSADLVRLAPAVIWRVAPPSWLAVAVYYAAAATWWRMRPSRGRLGGGVGALACAAALWILADPRTLAAARGDGRLHVTFLDVGQGDAALVVFPHGATLLVDAGGLTASSAFDIGERVVAPVVRDAGFRRIDYVALTHGDPDHIGGAGAIVREFRPREVWEGISVPRSAPLTALRVGAQATGARWANVYRGDRLTVDSVEVVARHPAPADWERQKVRNDDSLVLELRWRDVSVVLTGDIGRAVEPAVAAAAPRSRLRVVKIPHHASLTSSTPAFVAALRPQIAIASAGRANHFGHPVPEVLERYRAIGAEIFRTDQDGAVTLATDGESIDVSTFTGRRLVVR